MFHFPDIQVKQSGTAGFFVSHYYAKYLWQLNTIWLAVCKQTIKQPINLLLTVIYFVELSLFLLQRTEPTVLTCFSVYHQ